MKRVVHKKKASLGLILTLCKAFRKISYATIFSIVNILCIIKELVLVQFGNEFALFKRITYKTLSFNIYLSFQRFYIFHMFYLLYFAMSLCSDVRFKIGTLKNTIRQLIVKVFQFFKSQQGIVVKSHGSSGKHILQFPTITYPPKLFHQYF